MTYTVNKELFDQAAKVVVAEQNATYAFFEEKFPGIGKGTIIAILRNLKRRKIARQTEGRKWVILVN